MGVVGNGQVQISVTVEIAPGYALSPLDINGIPGPEKFAGRVAEHLIGPRFAVSHSQVGPAIAVEVAPGHAVCVFLVIRNRSHAQAAARIFRQGKGPVEIAHSQIQVAVAIHIAPGQGLTLSLPIGQGLHGRCAQRPALIDIDPRRCAWRTRGRQIQIAIAVIVTPGNVRRGGAIVRGPTHLQMEIGRAAVAIDMIGFGARQNLIVAHGQIQVTVPVQIAPGHAPGGRRLDRRLDEG